MSNRNDYDYFDLNNFDDEYDSRDFRRRHPSNRQGSYNRRSPQSRNAIYSSRRPVKRNRKNKKRTRNRIIIVSALIIVLVLVIALLSVMFRGCGSGNKSATSATVSKDTISKQASSDEIVSTTAPKADVSDDLSPTYFKTPTIEDDNKNGEMMYNIYVLNGVGYELFGSDDERAQNYADTISGFADKLSGITVYDMVVPNHTEYGLPQRLKDSDAPSTSQADNIKAIYSKLSDNVTPVNAYNYLADHNTEYTYFNSDHHWTGLGAYYAYKAFADTNKLTPLSLEDCTEQTIEGFTGTFTNTASGLTEDTVHYWQFPYEVSMSVTTTSGTETYDSPYYSGAAGGTLTYGVFIMGDNPLTVLRSSSENAETGKKIAVVKESYGNAFVPYLTNNYEEVHIIDFRDFRDVETDLVSYCKNNDIEEVLFLNGVMSANTQIQLDSMSGLFD